MAFIFSAIVDLSNLKEPLDPPPSGWQLVGTYEYSFYFMGPPSPDFTECMAWNHREHQRWQEVTANHHEVSV